MEGEGETALQSALKINATRDIIIKFAFVATSSSSYLLKWLPEILKRSVTFCVVVVASASSSSCSFSASSSYSAWGVANPNM